MIPSWRGIPIVCAAFLFLPTQAQAKGIILITHGDTISHVGSVAQKHLEHPAFPKDGPKKVGFKYSYGGAFWIDFWTWGGEYCVYEGNKYTAIQPAVAAELLDVPESNLSKPFLYTFPLGLLLLAPVVIGGILLNRFSNKPSEVGQLFNDERYQQALNIVSEQFDKQEEAKQAAKPPDAPPQNAPVADGPTETPANEPATDSFAIAFEAGVEHLTSLGIPREEAERNLGAMVQVLAAAKE